jgi:hypothetical protein
VVLKIERGSTGKRCFGRGYGPVVRQTTQQVVCCMAKIMQTCDSNDIICDEQFALCHSLIIYKQNYLQTKVYVKCKYIADSSTFETAPPIKGKDLRSLTQHKTD